MNAFKGVEDKLNSLKSNAGHLLTGIENLSIDDNKDKSLGLELTENAMILPLVDANGQTQLVVIDRSTQLAREVLTSYFENGSMPVLAPPAIIDPVVVPEFIAPVPIVAPVPLVAPAPIAPVVVPAPIPMVAPVVPIPVLPIDLDAEKKTDSKKKHAAKKHHHKGKIGHVLKSAAKGLHKSEQNAVKKVEKDIKEVESSAKKVEADIKKDAEKIEKKVEHKKLVDLEATAPKMPSQELTNEVLLGLDKIKANSVNLAAQLKNTIELHAHEVAKPMLEGLFDIAKTSAKIASHMKDLQTQSMPAQPAAESQPM